MLLYLNDIEMNECLYVHGCEVKKNVKFPLILLAQTKDIMLYLLHEVMFQHITFFLKCDKHSNLSFVVNI